MQLLLFCLSLLTLAIAEPPLRVGYIFHEKNIKKIEEKIAINSNEVEYKRYTIDELLSEDTPQIDILLHKLTHHLAQDDLKEKMDQLKHYLHEHDEIKVVDPLESAQLLQDRTDTRNIMIKADLRVPLAIELEASASEKDIEDFLTKNNMRLPVICKPIVCSTSVSHDHVLIAKMEDFHNHLVPGRRYLVEQFINHHGRILKVYNIGNRLFILPKASISDIHPNEEAIAFDSQKPFPKLYPGRIAPVTPTEYLEMELVADVLRTEFQLSLFGFDVIQDSKTAEYYVVDMNYFPSFRPVKDLDKVIADHLLIQ